VKRSTIPWFVGATLAASLTLGCSKKEDVIIAAADQVQVSDADIDRDPMALLPGSAVGLIHVDAPAMFASEFGQHLQQLAQSRMPLPPSAGFVPTRDLTALYIGLYSMQGADGRGGRHRHFQPAGHRAGRGRHDPHAARRAAGEDDVRAPHPVRVAQRRVRVLTAHTALFGDETGIRRALDRLSEGRAHHDSPPWVDQLFATANAPTAGAFDLTAGASAEAAAKNFPFLHGLKTAKVVGNFQSPG